MTFGQVLRMLRTENNLTQSQLAKVLGVSESTVGMYERGQREPAFEMLEAIADYFNVDMDFLTGRSEIRRETSYGFPSDFIQLFGKQSDLDAEFIRLWRSLTPEQAELIFSSWLSAWKQRAASFSFISSPHHKIICGTGQPSRQAADRSRICLGWFNHNAEDDPFSRFIFEHRGCTYDPETVSARFWRFKNGTAAHARSDYCLEAGEK